MACGKSCSTLPLRAGAKASGSSPATKNNCVIPSRERWRENQLLSLAGIPVRFCIVAPIAASQWHGNSSVVQQSSSQQPKNEYFSRFHSSPERSSDVNAALVDKTPWTISTDSPAPALEVLMV